MLALKNLRTYFKNQKEKPNVENNLTRQTKLDRSYRFSKWKSTAKKAIEKKETNTPVVTAAENQAKYLQKFGVNFEIPQVVILGSKLFPKDPKYLLQLVHYNCPGSDLNDHTNKVIEPPKEEEPPESDESSCCADSDSSYNELTKYDKKVVSYNIDGEIDTDKTYRTQFREYRKGVHLELHKKCEESNSLKLVKQMVLGLESKTVVQTVIMKFSPDSKRLVLYMKEINKLQIINLSEDIEKTFDKDFQTG